MYITSKGKPKNITRKEAKEVANFYADVLLGRRLSNNIELLLLFSKEETVDSGYGGYCDWVDDNHRPRNFVIALDPDAEYNQILSDLAHEMTHLDQFAKGILEDCARKCGVRWEKKFYGGMKMPNETGYSKQPWEVEARKMAKILSKSYLKI